MTNHLLIMRASSQITMRVREFLHDSVWVFMDQALLSAANVFLMVLMARQLGPSAFGQFVLSYTALMFANTVQGALFTQPHNVLGATRTGMDYRRYTTATATAQVGFAALIALLVCLSGLGAIAAGHEVGRILLALAPACITWQLHEFVRRVLFTQAANTLVFKLDLVAYGGQVVLIVALWQVDALTPVSAVLAIGTAAACGLGIGLWQIRDLFVRDASRQLKVVKATAQENWGFGRWLLGAAIAYWLSSQLYPLLTAGMVGIAATGGMRAAQTLLGPTHILLRGMESMAPSRGARAFGTGGVPALRQSILRFAIPGGFAMAVYCGAISLLAGPLVRYVLGSEYASYAWLVRMYALYYACSFLFSTASIALRSMGLTAPVFFAQSVSAVFVLTLGVSSVYVFGLAGAAIGLVLNGALVAVILWYRVMQEMSRELPRTEEGSGVGRDPFSVEGFQG